ncbi:MAG: TetR/AcrR family transcriptional regulator [Anaerovoracaceae bacterium]
MISPQERKEKVDWIMERCFDCYCEHGINNTGIKALGAACNMTSANLYAYFDNLDDLIIKSTAHCMSKVEAEFMARSPKNISDIKRFLDEAPYWTAENHGKKYRFMYQVYTSPKYLEYGKMFFKGVEERYTEYAKQLEPRLNIPWDVIQPMIFTFVRASVHFALFEDELYMKSQMNLLWQMCLIMKEKYKDENFVGGKDYEK